MFPLIFDFNRHVLKLSPWRYCFCFESGIETCASSHYSSN